MEIAIARWLVEGAGQAALARASEFTGEVTTRLKRLREFLTAEQAAAVLQQFELRERGRAKFSAAERMYFTPLGLEQATDEAVAHYKAQRFVGTAESFDLCTGIGGDLMALASITQAVGHDLDEVSATFSRANLAVAGYPTTIVRTCNVTELDLGLCRGWHLDPDRRPAGRRTTRVELHEPSADAISGMLRRNPNAAIKLAPAASWPDAWTAHAEWEWISRDRQCRQLVGWFGELAHNIGRRRATVLANDGTVAGTIMGEGNIMPPRTDTAERFIMEPDVAVQAAQLTGALADRHGLAALASGAAYLTGADLPDDPLLACFEVEDILPLDVKKLKSALRHRDIGQVEIKVRGVEQDPSTVRKRLAPQGSGSRTLLLTRIGERHVAVIARRVSSGSPRL